MTHILEISLRGRAVSVYVELGPPADTAAGWTVKVGAKWCAILSVRDSWGGEYVGELTAENLMEIARVLRGNSL